MKKTVQSETTKKRTRSAPRKKTARAPRKKTTAPAPESKAFESADTPAEIEAEIARVAYFIYQRRIAEGIPGDSISDWHAAEEQVLSESNVAALA